MASNITSCSFVLSVFDLSQIPGDRKPQIAFAGRSNVGKSSLLNRLVGTKKKMAKVSSTPGKTRSLNFFLVNDKYYFVDLPGYGYAKVSKKMKREWSELLEDYLHSGQDLVGLVLLMDCRREPTPQDTQLVEWLSYRELPVVIALTKADKIGRDQLNRKVRQIGTQLGLTVIPFSTLSGVGRRELQGAIGQLLDEHKSRRRAE